MPFSIPGEVGELYDFGIELRDVTQPLTVKDRKGQNVNMTKCAYVCSTKQEQEEATELQRKDKLIQLGPTQMDREWDQWVQQTVGAWSSGLGQRVQFGGQGADPAAYWDGLGLIWPITDWQPVQPFMPPAYRDADSPSPGLPSYMGTVAGQIDGVGVGYAFTFLNSAGSVPELVFISGSTRQMIANPIGGGNPILDMEMAHGYIWLVGSDAANQISLFYVTSGLLATKLATVINSPGVTVPASAMSTGRVTNRQYVAVVTRLTPATNYLQDTITLYDVTTAGAAPSAAAFTTLQIPTGWTCEDTDFLGDDLVVSMTDGMESIVAAWNIASQSWRTLSQIPGASSVSLVPIAGGMFLIARNQAAGATQKTIDLYILQGNNLQNYGPLVPQVGSTPYPFVQAVSHPTGFGPYALFNVVVQDVAGGVTTVLIYAYDVLRGRIFKATALTNQPAALATALDKVPMAAFSAMARTSPAVLNCQWGMALNITTATALSPNIQEFLLGIQTTPGTSGPTLQGPFDSISGIIDWTSASPKNFRQLVARFSALPNNHNASIRLNVWIDQDPGALAAVPDFTLALFGDTSPGVTRLSLPINKLGVKLVWEVITGGGVYSGAFVNAPKLISVSVQAATGWVHHFFADLTRQALTNSGGSGDYVYDRQATDEVAAYNFLRQIWRQRGGECILSVPNGDVYNALIQMERGKSPKPFGVSTVSSQPQDRYEQVIEITIREDV